MLYSGIDLHKRSLVMQTLDTEQRWHGEPATRQCGRAPTEVGKPGDEQKCVAA
jgi:hypothetical protein